MDNLEDVLSVTHFFPTLENRVYMRRMKAKAGQVIGSHKHEYEHYSILCTGLVKVEYGDEVEWYESGDAITVPAGVEHKITAISDIVWFCIHGVEDADDISIMKGV